MTPREHADVLVRCFTGYVAQRDDPVNREHLRIASEWLRLIDADDPAVADIEALRASLETMGFAGSATIDLQLGVGAWATRARRRAIMRRKTGD
jgi:hypothetical protein